MGLRRIRCFVMLVMQTVSWVCATSRLFAANDASLQPEVISPQPADDSLLGSTLKSKGFERWTREGEGEEEKNTRGIGSSPPSCENKCYGCVPCEAAQFPTTGHFTLHYANYEPEGWRCKCGPYFYTP